MLNTFGDAKPRGGMNGGRGGRGGSGGNSSRGRGRKNNRKGDGGASRQETNRDRDEDRYDSRYNYDQDRREDKYRDQNGYGNSNGNGGYNEREQKREKNGDRDGSLSGNYRSYRSRRDDSRTPELNSNSYNPEEDRRDTYSRAYSNDFYRGNESRTKNYDGEDFDMYRGNSRQTSGPSNSNSSVGNYDKVRKIMIEKMRLRVAEDEEYERRCQLDLINAQKRAEKSRRDLAELMELLPFSEHGWNSNEPVEAITVCGSARVERLNEFENGPFGTKELGFCERQQSVESDMIYLPIGTKAVIEVENDGNETTESDMSEVQASEDIEMYPLQQQLKSQARSSQGTATSASSPDSPLHQSEYPFSEVIVTEKLKPAVITEKNKVDILTNFWEIAIESREVFRYDVQITVSFENGRSTILTEKHNSESSKIEKQKICMEILRVTMKLHGSFGKETGTVYDGATQLYTSEELVNEGNPTSLLAYTILPTNLSREILDMARWKDAVSIDIHITPNSEMPSFDIADYSRESNRDLSKNDKVLSNFLNLLTSQSARDKGMTVFGSGKIFDMKRRGMDVGKGQEQRNGCDKGIKFIEGNTNSQMTQKTLDDESILPAVLLDSKRGLFFKTQFLLRTVQELLQQAVRFDWDAIAAELSKGGRVKNSTWVDVNKYVKGLRFSVSYSQRDYVISGISIQPISELTFPSNTDPDKNVSVAEHITQCSGKKLDKNLPAVVVKMGNKTLYFAMETVELMPNQRVPLSKQSEPPRPVPPSQRWNEIIDDLKALELTEQGHLLKLFGVSISSQPKTVTGVRREAPAIFYRDNRKVELDHDKCNWSQSRNDFIRGSSVETCIIACFERSTRSAKAAFETLRSKCRFVGIQVSNWELKTIRNNDENMMETLDQFFKNISVRYNNPFVVFVDEETSKSHDLLKLLERKYNVATQQLTTKNADVLSTKHMTRLNFLKKMNLKLGGLNYRIDPENYAKNLWIANDGLLIISYDVAHPGKVDTNEPVRVPSVVGFSFNGGAQREAFVGDYHYQYPKKEKVDEAVLVERTKWMLGMYVKNRNCWPNELLIIRDGVSEGQYEMVMNEELAAIRSACTEYAQKELKKDWNPPVALVIATKRHSAKLFKENNRRVENVLPLTCVDQDITRPNMNEFIMVSAKPIQGTAKPVCYQLLVNEIGLKNMDELEAFMVALTFSHQICDMPISLPEPVYQADEWAKRGNNMWKIYDQYFDLPMSKTSATPQADFEAMTSRLSHWRSKFNARRVNA